MMNFLKRVTKISVGFLSASLAVTPLVANPANGSGYPQTVSALWGGMQAAIENDPLNSVSYKNAVVPNFFSTPGAYDVKIEVVRFDLGALIGTNPDGSAKVKSPKIAALYARPVNADGSTISNLPAIVNIHGGGQFPTSGDTSLLASRGYAVISINWGGKNMDSLFGGYPGYAAVPITDGLSLGVAGADYDNTDWDGLAAGFARASSVEFFRPSVTDPVIDAIHAPSEEVDNETYSDGATLFEHAPHPMNAAFILNSYAARRAITYLESRPEIDDSKIGAIGFSMGGITTTITGTDPRLKCIVPAVGGTGWDYENYYGLTTSNKGYNGDPSTFSWYQCTVSQESYWPEIQVPSMFLNATNDFNAPFDRVQPSIDLLPAGVKGVMVNTPHANHIPDTTSNTSLVLWLDEHLKGVYAFPEEPASSIDLTHPCGVPVFSVTPDPTAPQTIKEVEIFYGDEYFSLERFWHKGIAVETSAGTWQAALPAFDTSKPFIAFARVTYEAGVNVVTGVNSTNNDFSVTSEVQFLNNDGITNELTANGIVADTSRDRDLTSSDDGLEDWHNYATYGGNFNYGTFKVGSERYEGPDGASALQLQITSAAAANTNTVSVTVGETWGFQSFQLYRAVKTLPTNGTNTIFLARSDFKRVDNPAISLANWSDIKLLSVKSAALDIPGTYSNWVGGKPDLPLLSWIGGSYTTNANEAPAFSADKFVKTSIASGIAYSATVVGDAVDPESQALTYYKMAGPAWLTVATNGTLGGTPSVADVGTNRFIVKTKDAAGGTDYTELEIVVTPGVSTTSISPSTCTAPATGGVYPVTVNSTSSWAVTESLSWLSVSTTSGSGNGLVNVTVAPNATSTPRTGTVTIGGEIHTVIQAGNTVQVVINDNSPGTAAWDFPDIYAPKSTDHVGSILAPIYNASFSIPTSNPALGGGLTALNDGAGQFNNNDLANSLRFDAAGPNRIQVDLGSLVGVYEINTFTWHLNSRHTQLIDVYYSTSSTAPTSTSAVNDGAGLLSAGWQYLAKIDTTSLSAATEQQIASSVRTSLPTSLVNARHILFDYSSASNLTLVGEIDILTQNNYTVDPDGGGLIPHCWLLEHGLSVIAGNASGTTSDLDGDGMTAAQEYWAGTDPTDVNSLLQVCQISHSGTNVMLEWESAAGKTYDIWGGSDLASWTKLVPNVSSGGATTTGTVPNQFQVGETKYFYRIEVQPSR